MDRQEMLSEIRRRIGDPSVNEVTAKQLEAHLMDALRFLASELKYRVVTETNALQLVADQRFYPLPDDLVEMFQVTWSTQPPLVPQSTARWDLVASDWRNIASGTLREYAIEGRRLILSPPPSADVLTTDSTLTLYYAAAPAFVGAGGVAELPPLDHSLACWLAAEEWLSIHPSEVNQARQQACQSQITRRLPDAKRRAQNVIRSYAPRFRFRTNRRGAAR